MKVCGIVGYKNSGKTFMVQKLIRYFVNKKLKVATIKHAHHNFDIDKPNTDSFLHRKSGSEEIIVSSSKRWAKITELKNSNEKNLSDLLNELNNPDIVIVEGFKNDNHLKIEIIDDKSDKLNFLFPNLKNVIAIICDLEINTKITRFKRNQVNNIAEYILKNT